ncbi:acid phosphatase/Vanadium-dependent haloperoxidase, partial [Ophiobolus disseminans]
MTPRRKHPLVPGFINPPPFGTFLRRNWFDITTILLCVLTAWLLYKFCPPLMPRYFPLFENVQQTSWGIRHSQPFRSEYVTTIMSAAIAFVIPALIMGLIALWGTRGFGDANAALVGLGYALATSTLLIVLLKIFIGGLRPHFLTVCNPVMPPPVPGIGAYKQYYTASQVCLGPVKEIQMSFPSGHASAAFAGFGFLALYLNAKFKIISNGGRFRETYGSREPGPMTSRVHHWKSLLFALPWLVALLLSLSKIRDGWHHPIDILFGALIGTLFAHLAYRMCYRSVYDWKENHIPLEGDGGE